MSRILLSVLLFAGAFTRLLGGRLESVRILAQKMRTDKVVIKRFPFPQLTAIEKARTFTLEPVSFTVVRGDRSHAIRDAQWIRFFPEGVSVWAGFWA